MPTSSLSKFAYEPRVLQVANMALDEDDLPNLHYLRVTSRLSTFLLQDTAELLEDNSLPLENSLDLSGNDQLQHRFILLQHPRLDSSIRTSFCPEYDILWLSHETHWTAMDELSTYYGQQLVAIQNVLFEETEWNNFDRCMELLERLPGVRIIYVWLDSCRFLTGEAFTNAEGYYNTAAEFQARDQAALRGRQVMIEYIDYERIIYGGFRANNIE